MTQSQTPPLWFWIIATIALLWNLAGLAAFAMHLMMTPEQLASLPAAEQQLYTDAPGWLNVAFGMAVVGGSLASLMLLLRNLFAPVLFSLSLLGVLAQNSYSFLMSNTFEVLGKDAMIMPLVVITLAVFLLWFSLSCKSRGLLR